MNAAALQFVRKISRYHHPSQANQEAFYLVIGEIAAASQRLLDSLVTPRRTPRHKREARTDKTSPGPVRYGAS